MTQEASPTLGTATASVFIGIVTRDRASIVPKAILSAISQRNCEMRVGVIDDGSTDATLELSRKFPGVKWERWSTSRGYLAARNHWIKSAGEKYFAGLDDDAWFWEGDEIATALSVLERDPKVASVAFDILSADRPHPVPRSGAEQAAMFIGCGHVLRLSAAREVGFYEPSPGSYGGEEKDLCIRLLDAGYKIMKLPGVHVWHDKTAVARHVSEQHRSGVCNDLVMAFRRTPGFMLPLAIIAKLYRHVIFSLRHGLIRPCLEGFLLFARSIPNVLKTRRPVKMSTLRSYVRLTRLEQ
jgi:GT2 family glycosyltransferase